ncbi:hypothetical protein PENNAL_c0754G07116, partial [Penicillium nalgiovense]
SYHNTFILGGGPRIGHAVAEKLASQGYSVALGRRSVHPSVDIKNVMSVTVDVASIRSVETAFAQVRTKLGIPEVVVYNAASLTFPSRQDDPFSVPPEAFANDTAINVIGGYTALCAATRGWVELREGSSAAHKHRGVFIATGNVTPFYPNPFATSLGAGKAGLVHLIKLAEQEYKATGDRQVLPSPWITRWYVQAWSLTSVDVVGRFLGVNIGTPLQRKLSKLACLLFGIAVVFAIVCMAANEFSSNNEVIMYAVATGISMIPACLVVVLTITMARNVIVRKLDSLEALGAVTDICSDKTGTLTQGKMVVQKAWIPSRGTYSVGPSNEPFNPTVGDVSFSAVPPSEFDHEKPGMAENAEGMVSGNRQLEDFLDVASMANLSHVYKSEEGEWSARGEPTEIAIHVFASRFNWNRDRWMKKGQGEGTVWHQKAEFPFDSTVKKMSVIFNKITPEEDRTMVFTKGAVERIAESCTSIIWDQESSTPVPMTDHHREKIIENMEELAKLGL